MPRARGRSPRIQTRVTVTAALFTLLVSLAIYALLLVLIQRNEAATQGQELGRHGRSLVAMVRAGLPPSGEIVTSREWYSQVIGPGGRVVAWTETMRGAPPVDFAPPGRMEIRRDGTVCGVETANGEGCFQIVVYRAEVGANVYHAYAMLPAVGILPRPKESVRATLWIPVFVGTVGYATWRTAGRTLRPVDDIRAELDEITATDLGRRVPVPEHDDEIARLAVSVNNTLERLEAAVARQRAFVSDVSHELRSPLAGMRTELELALPDAEGEVKESLNASLRNADRIQDVLESLLSLARLEAAGRDQSEPVDLRELADQVVLRTPRSVRVVVPDGEPVIVHGSPPDLVRLFTNLVGSAERHAQTEVRLDMRRLPGGYAMVELLDDGATIPVHEREQAFERLSRIAEGRHDDAGGTALGLSIARDIAHAHHGSLRIQDRADGRPGARLVLMLPA